MSEPVLIDVKSGGQHEIWLVVYPDGRIIEHTENDGHAFLRHGSQASDTEITMAAVAALGERCHMPLVEQVRKALASFGWWSAA